MPTLASMSLTRISVSDFVPHPSIGEDSDFAGYQNLGSAANSFQIQATQNQFIHGQGDDDYIRIIGRTDDRVYGGSGNDYIDAGDGNDWLNGGSGNDFLIGGAGNDTLDGSLGNDTLIGGLGVDILTGGYGADRFAFISGLGSLNESRVGQADIITDFTHGEDKIGLPVLDDGAKSGDYVFINAAQGSTNAHTLWVTNMADGQHVFVNIDGGAADMEIIVHTINNVALNSTDFIL